MPKPRNQLVDIGTTPYYHCVARCVRRAFLCGNDHYTGRNFDHRKHWLVDQIKHLARIFAIDVCAYAVMSNHYHLVIHVNQKTARSWNDQEVVNRWLQLFKGPILIQQFHRSQPLTEAESQTVKELIELYRSRLADLSWYFRCLNEYIARKANEEDQCTGRFWEGRFKSQALKDESALLACMAYVDLNPIRAGLAHDLEHSEFTSIQERLRTLQSPEKHPTASCELASFKGEEQPAHHELPFYFHDYLELVEWSGRADRRGKKGMIPSHVPRLLDRLGLSELSWAQQVHAMRQRHVRRRATV